MLRNAANTDLWIDFIGGPYDGHRQTYQSSAMPLPADVFWLVTQDAFRQLGNHRLRSTSHQAVIASVALYELDRTAEPLTYRYAGAIGAKAFSDAIRALD